MTRNVKILATLGPASSDRETIKSLAEAGANVFRLNMSHGTHASTKKVHDNIRSVETELGYPIAILGDLQGPKLRCGIFEKGHTELVSGQSYTFDFDDVPGDNTRVRLPHKEILSVLEPGTKVLVNDGLLEFIVKKCDGHTAKCEVIVGGVISNKKGVNVPSITLPLSSLSEKDKKDLEFLCELGIDWLALSFVQRVEDVEEAKALVKGRAKLVSKIEKPNAIDNFDDILAKSDGIMIARGDLGVELPVEKLPGIQKRLIRECRVSGKPVIVATQMLESMITSPVPTRAEVSDVATAIFEGADAIMLSAESASGQFPVDAVKMMVAVASQVEQDPNHRTILDATNTTERGRFWNPLTVAAREISSTGEIDAICCFTQSGHTAFSQARERPPVPVFALTPEVDTARVLTLVWGVNCRLIKPVDRFKGAVASAVSEVNKTHLTSNVQTGGKIAIMAGVPIHKSGTTNILRMAALDGSDLQSFD